MLGATNTERLLGVRLRYSGYNLDTNLDTIFDTNLDTNLDKNLDTYLRIHV